MRLYFLRHGHAESGLSVSDHDRQLTTEGVKRLQTATKVMKALKVKPTMIYSSPRVRAQQTAQIVSERLKRPMALREEVNFGFDAAAVAKLIGEHTDSDDLMFVGHEPTFSMTIGTITGAHVVMKKGGLARVDLLDRRDLSGDLLWLIAPKIFDVLGD